MQKSAADPRATGVAARRGRGRPRAFDREAALNQATCLFWRKGFEATSMADLTEAMGIGAPSLYAAFGSKEALYAEALHHYQRSFEHLTWGRFESAPSARAAVEALLMDSAASLTAGAEGGARGCMLTLSEVDAEGHARLCQLVRDSRGVVLERLEARVARAVRDGELPAATDVHALARFVQTVQNGMSLLARDGAHRAELESVARVAMQGWDSVAKGPVAREAK